jgi:trans-aconitate 2-methyltransferase
LKETIVPDWRPAHYLQFADERTRPARDLLAQVPLAAARTVFDLGCGPGNSTALLAERFPGARIVGVDNSPAMLEAARKALPQAEFAAADLNQWLAPADADLLFSNATFQWLPDHLAILARLLRGLRPGAVLAVQMPDNLAEPSHVLMRETAENGPWADKLREASAARAVLPAPQAYYEALKPHCARLDLWHTIYNHPLEGAPAIVEWLKATGLRPFLAPLDDAGQREFLDAYRRKIAEAYPPAFDGRSLLRFPRLFMVAVA